jgi:hypothetical protein
VILGIDWLSKHNGMINCAKKAVRLTASSGKELKYVAENLATDKAASNRIVLNHLDATLTMDIRTVSNFLEELLGMPPDRELEFVIELVPGTSIFKRPYKMAAILDDLPDKMGDPGVLTISCLIGTQKFDQAL